MIEGISAVALGTHEMPRAVRFYRALGFEVPYGGGEPSFTSIARCNGQPDCILR
jgi:catechol 2,3-dioxygenase-like lactoylglutathione lyase family enzyme